MKGIISVASREDFILFENMVLDGKILKQGKFQKICYLGFDPMVGIDIN